MKFYFTAFLAFCALASLSKIQFCAAQIDIELILGENDTLPDNLSTGRLPSTTELPKSLKTAKYAVRRVMAEIGNLLMRAGIQNNKYPNMNVSKTCKSHLMKMVSGIRNLDLWAVQMYDASGKIPNGMFSGNIFSYGDYDGCLRVDANGLFRGRYCILELTPEVPDVKELYHTYKKFRGPDKLIENALKMASVSPNFIGGRTSVCIPSTCTKADMENILKSAIEYSEIRVSSRIPTCEAGEPVKLETIDFAAMCLLSIAVLLFIIATVTEIVLKLKTEDEAYKTKSGTPLKTLLCFSGYSNTVALLRRDDSLIVFQAIKMLAMCHVVMVHNFGFLVGMKAGGNLINLRDFVKQIPFQFVIGSSNGIVVFFVMSSFFMAYHSMRSGNTPVHIQIIRRYFRLTPSIVFLIAAAILLPHIGSGPVWKEDMDLVVGACRNYWWINLLYLNNFVTFRQTCLGWLWYIAADMHLYIAAVFVLAIVKKYPKARRIMFVLCLAAGIGMVVGNSYYYDLTLEHIFSLIEDIDVVGTYLTKVYARSYLHAIPVTLGVTLGCFVANRPKPSFSVPAAIGGWVVMGALALAIMLGPYEWFQGNLPNFDILTLYLCGSKIIISSFVVWGIFFFFKTRDSASKPAEGTKQSSKKSLYTVIPFVVLGRLSYMTYLVHSLVQVAFFASNRTLMTVDHRTQIFTFLGGLIVVFIVAYISNLLFEAPFVALDRMIFPKTVTQQVFKLPSPTYEIKEMNGIPKEVIGNSEKHENADMQNGKSELNV